MMTGASGALRLRIASVIRAVTRALSTGAASATSRCATSSGSGIGSLRFSSPDKKPPDCCTGAGAAIGAAAKSGAVIGGILRPDKSAIGASLVGIAGLARTTAAARAFSSGCGIRRRASSSSAADCASASRDMRAFSRRAATVAMPPWAALADTVAVLPSMRRIVA